MLPFIIKQIKLKPLNKLFESANEIHMLSFNIKQKLKPLNKRFEPANEIHMLSFIIKQKLKPLNKRFESANEIYMLPFIIKQIKLKLNPLNKPCLVALTKTKNIIKYRKTLTFFHFRYCQFNLSLTKIK